MSSEAGSYPNGPTIHPHIYTKNALSKWLLFPPLLDSSMYNPAWPQIVKKKRLYIIRNVEKSDDSDDTEDGQITYAFSGAAPSDFQVVMIMISDPFH